MAIGKKVTFGRPRHTSSDVAKMDEWVSRGAEVQNDIAETVLSVEKKSSKAASVANEKMKRLSMDLPEQMHKDLMKYCVDHGTKASVLVRELLRKKIYR